MSSPQDGRSIWEILNELESKLIDSLHQTSDLVLPQLIDTSQSIYDSLQSISHAAYNKSIDSGWLNNETLSSIINFPTQLGSKTPTSATTTVQSIQSSSSSTSNLPFPASFITIASSSNPNHPTSSSWVSKFFKPRNLIILTGLYFSSKFTINLLVSSDYFDRFIRSNPSIQHYLPTWVRSRRSLHKSKPNRSHRHSSTAQSRLQVIIILGADPGSVGHQIALHLTQIGFVVIASVGRLESVNVLEREGSGWLKALVLDPPSGQTRAFNRSLAACLSLHFPFNHSSSVQTSLGDAHQSQVVGLINCLPISSPDDLRPVESIDLEDDLIFGIKSIAGVSLDVVKFVLPMMRNSIEKFAADDGVILTLFPTKTSSVSLPYLGPSTIANQTLETLMSTLRRELLISNSDSKRSIRIVNERIGSFRPSAHFSPKPIDDGINRPASLPIHLHSIYAPSLSRRLGFLNGTLIRTTGCLPIVSMTGSPLSQLIQRVQQVIESPSIKLGSSLSAGKEVWKFKLIKSLLPDRLLDRWLTVAESLNGWVRRKVISEIDLESNENLERVIQKRNFSSHSSWKNRFFIQPSGDTHYMDDQPRAGSKVESATGDQLGKASTFPDDNQATNDQLEGDTTIQNIDLVEPTGESEAPEGHGQEEGEELELVEETGSVIDKGPESEEEEEERSSVREGSETLKHSFVGSEIDWKEDPPR